MQKPEQHQPLLSTTPEYQNLRSSPQLLSYLYIFASCEVNAHFSNTSGDGAPNGEAKYEKLFSTRAQTKALLEAVSSRIRYGRRFFLWLAGGFAAMRAEITQVKSLPSTPLTAPSRLKKKNNFRISGLMLNLGVCHFAISRFSAMASSFACRLHPNPFHPLSIQYYIIYTISLR